MPAAAVIPAPIAYIKVVAVKKLVVESMTLWHGNSAALQNAVVACHLVIFGQTLRDIELWRKDVGHLLL